MAVAFGMKNQQHQSVYSRLMSDFGRRDKKGDKNNDYTIEEQIVLRVPPAIAEGVRQMLKGKQNNVESDLSFQMSMWHYDLSQTIDNIHVHLF